MKSLPSGHELSRDWVRLDEEMSHHYVEYGVGMHPNIYPYLEKLQLPLVTNGAFRRNSLILNIPAGEGDNRGVFRWLLTPEEWGQIHLANSFIGLSGIEDMDSFVLASAVLDIDEDNYLDRGTFKILNEDNKDSILRGLTFQSEAEINNFLAFQVGLLCVDTIMHAIGKEQASHLYPMMSEESSVENFYIWEIPDARMDGGESPDMAFTLGNHKVLLHSKRAQIQQEAYPRMVYYTVMHADEPVFRSSYGSSTYKGEGRKTCNEGLIEILNGCDSQSVSDGLLGIKVPCADSWSSTVSLIINAVISRILPSIDCKCP